MQLLSEVLRSVSAPDGLIVWIDRVRDGLVVTDANYPFIGYATDWLAFAHLVIALAFWGPLRDPVRNIWVIEWGMVCCVAIIPLALIAGPIRQIPFWWTVIDISFGVVGIIPLIVVRRLVKRLATADSGKLDGVLPATQECMSGCRLSGASGSAGDLAPGP